MPSALKNSRIPLHSPTNSADLSEFMEFTADPSSAILEDNIFPLGLDNGELVMFYRVISWETGADSLFAARSTDTGLSWQSPQLILGSEAWAYDGFRGQATASGRLILSFYQWGDLGPLVYLFHSDDHGATWSEPVESVLPAFGTFSTINDSTLWYTYSNDETGNVHYRTSADDGNSWSEDRLLVEADDFYDRPLVAPGNGSTLYLYFSAPSEELSHRRSFLSQIFQRTSTDGGATWSSAVSLSPIDMAFVNGQGSAEFYPRRQSDGTLWIFYVAAALKEVEPPFGGTGYQATEDWNVFYRTSADGGQTWGAPQQFTRYAGKDIGAQSTVVNDQLFVLFNTSRWQPVQTGNTYLYGVPGITQDNNPPPNRSPAS